MQPPKIPDDEEFRLSALKSLDLLDTEPEEAFDRVTRMCKTVFDVPIALVSLIDADRQWFKSRQGLIVTETSRDVSLCGHAIHHDEPFIVNDLSKDSRFADNPFIQENTGLRFYAGCPLKVFGKYRIGTLCIIDSKPRELSETDELLLNYLASVIEDEIQNLRIVATDELTGLTNQDGLKLLLEQMIKTDDHARFSAIVFDVDDFTLLNMRLGVRQGNQLLKDLSGLLLDCFKDDSVVARIGSDEFAVIMPGSDRYSAEQRVPSLLQMIEDRNLKFNRDFDIYLSYGITSYDGDKHDSVQAILTEATEDMHSRKRTD